MILEGEPIEFALYEVGEELGSNADKARTWVETIVGTTGFDRLVWEDVRSLFHGPTVVPSHESLELTMGPGLFGDVIMYWLL